MTNHREMAAAEAELGNVRHSVARTVGSEEGLDLTVEMAVPMAEFGLGAEGAVWLDEHLEALTEPDPFLWAKAILALWSCAASSRAPPTPLTTSRSRRTSPESARSGRCGSPCGREALAKLWGGDLAAGAAMVDDPELLAVVRSMRDPWVDAQLERIRRCSSWRGVSSVSRSTCCRW